MSNSAALHPFRGGGLVKLLAILAITLNMRGAITCVGPLLKTIQAQFGLSGTAAGLLTSLPLFAFGLLSAYAAPLARRLGMEAAIMLSISLLVAGLGIRYIDGTAFLYLGTAFIGCGMAFNNVLLPGLLRRDFPGQLTIVTALFTMVLATCGGIGSGVSIPLANFGGWRFSLVAWIFPAVLALLFWIPQLRTHTWPQAQAEPGTRVWNQLLAWQVSLFMACQSTAFYVMISWFPSMMADLTGTSAARSGAILFIYQVFVLGSVMLTPVFIHRLHDQRLLGVVLSVLILVGFCGLLADAPHALGWMIVMGLGAGGALVLAITLFGMRAGTAAQSIALSGMAQAVGYTMAAITPIVIGLIHDLTHQWTGPLLLMIVLAVMQVAMAYLAGRKRTIRAGNTPTPDFT
ncbi:MAG: MFS transporter [Pseudomonadota bacterium]